MACCRSRTRWRACSRREVPLDGGRDRSCRAGARPRARRAPLQALRTQPPFHASAMDGYAVRAADLAALPATPRRGRHGRRRPRLSRDASGRRGGAHLHGRADAGRRRRHRHPGGRRAQDGERSTSARGGAGPRAICARPAWTSAPARSCSRPVAGSARATWRWRRRWGYGTLAVRRRPRVAILATGDELVAARRAAGPRPDRRLQPPRPSRRWSRRPGGGARSSALRATRRRPSPHTSPRRRDADILVTTRRRLGGRARSGGSRR